MAADYTALITSEHKNQPNFAAWVGLLSKALGDISDTILSITSAFSVDSAVGVQLDAVGKWVGIDRNQYINSTGVFFSWNTTGLGWNEANWLGPYDATTVLVTLDDTTYRILIKAKIGSNYWLGTQEGLTSIGVDALTDMGVSVTILDNLDMTTRAWVVGSPTPVLLDLIKRGITPPKAAGVKIASYTLVSAPGSPTTVLSPPSFAKAGVPFGKYAA
jgi:hypothetical protein